MCVKIAGVMCVGRAGVMCVRRASVMCVGIAPDHLSRDSLQLSNIHPRHGAHVRECESDSYRWGKGAGVKKEERSRSQVKKEGKRP